MAVLSKSFQEWLSGRSCNELLHPHTCRRAAFENLFRFAWSNSKYYLPVVLLHLGKHSLRSGGANQEILLDTLWYYTQLVFGGVVDASLISISMCSLRHFLGKFHLYTLLFIPATLGGAFCALFPKRVKHLQHTAIFQALIESLLLHFNPLSKLLASSVCLQTVIFMICSAVILEGKQRRWYNGFWFLTPDAPTDPENPSQAKSCTHTEQDCGLYIVRGIRNYLIVGIALDVFRYLVSSSKLNQWKLSHLNFQSTAWLGCYVGLYRAVHCYLRNIPIIDESLKHPLAEFLGGLSYFFYPKLTILSYALLEAIRTLSPKKHESGEYSKIRFGWGDFFFPLSLAYLIHNYVVEEQRVSALSGVIIDSTTANYARNISKRIARLQ